MPSAVRRWTGLRATISSMASRWRRWLAGTAIAVAVAAAAPTPASATAFIQGFTWYPDGGVERSGPPGTTISAFATEARPNRPFKLVTTPVSQFGCQDHELQVANPFVRYSSARGFIGLTTGVINRPVGQYHVCFFEQPPVPGHATTTYPLLFTVI